MVANMTAVAGSRMAETVARRGSVFLVPQYVVVDAVSDIITYFFFQAEDGIRDLTVTGVQTCALPISNVQGKQYWRCLEELAEGNDFRAMIHDLFPEQEETWTNPMTRRQFLTLLGASPDRKSVV